MDTLTDKETVIQRIRLAAGSGFECDEEAILKEYHIQGENKSGLAIKVLSIFGGFLATLAFLGFMAIAGFYDSDLALLIFGIVFIITAIWLNKKYDKLIIDTFSVSLYITGFVLLVFALSDMGMDENIIAIIVIVIAVMCLTVTQNYILSFLSILAISLSFMAIIIFNSFYNLIHAYLAAYTLILTYVFLNEAKLISSSKKLSRLYNPVRIGLIISLLFGFIAIGKRHLIPISENYIWISSVVMILIALYLIHTILKINGVKALKDKGMIYGVSLLILLSTIFSPSISGAIILILLSFLVNYKTGLGIGIIALIYFISQYYYDLNFTLLTKSMMLFGSGIMFLIFYLFITKKQGSNEKI